MKSFPKISIVTPSFNRGQYIEQTISSILEQNYPNLEYIIIDGGSKDNTIEIIKKHKKYLTYWVSEPDRGQAHAINKGLEKCTGKLFNWINSDDYLEPGSLFELAKQFKENPNAHILCGYTRCFFEETGEISHTYQMGLKKTVADTILNVEMNQPGSFYKLDIVKELGGVNESLRYVFDDELWFKYLCKYGLKHINFINTLLVHFRLHSDSKSIGEGYKGFNEELYAIYFDLAKQLKFPDYIIDEIQKDIKFENYKTTHWNFNCIDDKAFLAYFCNKYQYTFYKDFKYAETKEAYKIQKKYFKQNRKSRLLFIKLFLIPGFILKLLRNR